MNNNEKILDNCSELLTFLKKESESSLFAELCFLIGKNKLNQIICAKMQNRAKDPAQYFIIDPYDYLSFINKNECFLIFHSHLVGDEKPSEFDKITSENCCYPFFIYSVNSEKFFIYEPEYKDYDVNIVKVLKELI